MSKETIKTVVRVLALAVALMVTIHILTHDDRSNWLALIPGAVLGSAVFHFTKLRLGLRAA